MERRWQRRASIRLQTLFYFYAVLQLQVPPSSATTPDNNVDSGSTVSRGADCHVFEGDICVNDKQWEYLNSRINSISSPLEPSSESPGSLAPQRIERAVVKMELFKWINGLVPYTLDNDLSTAAVNAIRAAMNQFTQDTCIRFIPKNPFHYDYVHFFSGNGCYSSIGRRGGKQDISIGPTCVSKGVVMHEIFHALGRWHEQSRPDRDQYIIVNPQNIKPKYARNFQSINENLSTTNDVPYDFDSIMHYDAYAFSRNNEPTIQPLDNTVVLERLGQRTHLSEKDLDHIRELYCPDQMPSNVWSSWSRWSECSSTCGGGKQVRTRTCIGGDQCSGSSSASRNCSTAPCPTIAVTPSWSPWSEWSGCSRTCGSGKRLRLRNCLDGDGCVGDSMEYEPCNTKECPSKWAEWSGWSDCSKSCDGGVRYRSRDCLPGLHCTGRAKEEEPCNVNVTCHDDLEWSECSRACGGGVQWRLNSSSGEIVRRSCNEQACHNETCLQGVKYIGCYRMFHSRLRMYENMTKELSDSPANRTEPVRKCGTTALDHGNMYFSLSEGMCFSGSNRISDYIEGEESQLCIDGRGSSREAGQFVMDVYHIDDMTAFQDSSAACANFGKDFCSEPRTWVSSSHHTLPSVPVICLLLLLSVLYTCVLLL